MVLPSLALSLPHKGGHCLRVRAVPSVPSTAPGPEKEFSKLIIHWMFLKEEAEVARDGSGEIPEP